MSSTLPQRSNHYLAPDKQMPLSEAVWNAVFGDIGTRLDQLEAQRRDLQALIDLGTGQALAVIQANVAPALAALNAAIASLRHDVTLAEDAVARLLNGNIPAANVTFTPTSTIAATNVQAAIVELMGDDALSMAALQSSVTGLQKSMSSLQSTVSNLGAVQFINATANATLTKGNAYRLLAISPITLTLPASPAMGDSIRIIDGETITQSLTHVIARNGKTIMGLAEDLTVNVPGADFIVWYNGTEWRLF